MTVMYGAAAPPTPAPTTQWPGSCGRRIGVSRVHRPAIPSLAAHVRGFACPREPPHSVLTSPCKNNRDGQHQSIGQGVRQLAGTYDMAEVTLERHPLARETAGLVWNPDLTATAPADPVRQPRTSRPRPSHSQLSNLAPPCPSCLLGSGPDHGEASQPTAGHAQARSAYLLLTWARTVQVTAPPGPCAPGPLAGTLLSWRRG